MAFYPSLKWDLSRYQTVGAADAVTKNWESENEYLNQIEKTRISQYKSWKEKALATAVHKKLSKDKVAFQAVENQILSLLLAWKSVVHEKERYDLENKKKHKRFELNEDVLSHEAFLRITDIIPARVMLGISDLDRLVTPPESKKRRRTESDEDEDEDEDAHELPQRTKRMRIKDKVEETLSEDSDYGSDGEKQGTTDEEKEPYQRNRSKGRKAINILFKKQLAQQSDEEEHHMSKKRRR